MRHIHKLYTATVCFAVISASSSAFAQTYPARSIELSVPYGAGGTTDVIARRLATHLEKELGQTIVVVNKPGAQGTLQSGLLARSKADGYSIGMLAFTATTYTTQLMSKPPFTIDDFDILGGVGSFSYGLVVPNNSPIKDIKDLIEASKKNGGVSYAVTGAPNNVPFVKLANATGGQFEEINYKSGMEAVTAAAGGHVDVALQNPPDFVTLVQSGAVRLIASATESRVRGFPDVPTLQEQGHDIVVTSGIGLAAPKGIPEEAKVKLENALMKVLHDPDYISFMNDQYIEVKATNGAQYKKMLEDGYKNMSELIKALNVPMIN